MDFEKIAQRVAQVGFDFAAQATEAIATCNYCNSPRQVVISHRDRYGFPAQAVMCNDCGLVYLSPRLTPAAYMEFYARYYRPLVSAVHNRVIDAQTVQVEQHEYAEVLVRFLRAYVAPGEIGRVLDVGGSTGVVAEHVVRHFGCAGMVIDPAGAELHEAAARGLQTCHGLVEEIDVATFGRFDLVLLCQTIDHLLDIRRTLQSIHTVLAADGWFYADILDFGMNLRRNGVRGAIKTDHPYYLTTASMEAYLQDLGFTVAQQLVHPDGMHIGYLCRKVPVPARRAALAMPEARERAFAAIRDAQK
jgi:SAM-dependent methyltransferase